MPPKSKPRRAPPPLPDASKRPTVPAPSSRTKPTAKAAYLGEEYPTGTTNENASRWRMIMRDIRDLEAANDIAGLAILYVAAHAMAEMPPVNVKHILQEYDVMGERQRHALAAISHSLVTTSRADSSKSNR